MLVLVYLNNLLNMEVLKSSFYTTGLKKLYAKSLMQIRYLELMGVKPDT